MFADLSWKTLHQVISQTIAEMADEQQTLDVPSLRRRLEQMAESETNEEMVLCYWQASKILLHLPATVTASQLLDAARRAFRSPPGTDPL